MNASDPAVGDQVGRVLALRQLDDHQVDPLLLGRARGAQHRVKTGAVRVEREHDRAVLAGRARELRELLGRERGAHDRDRLATPPACSASTSV